MNRLMVVLLAIVVCVAAAAEANAQDARAQELIKQAREALGGEAKLGSIQSLSAAARFRRSIPDIDTQMEGELEMDFLLPDKFVKTEITNGFGGGSNTRIEGLNGDKPFRDFRSSRGGMVMFRSGNDTPEARAAAEAAMLRSLRGDFARHTLMWLLAAPPSFPLEFTYAGEAESDDGRADVIDVKGPDGFNARLFLDKEKHHPLMLTYRDIAPRMVVRRGGPAPASAEERDKMLRDAQRQAEPPKQSEIQIFFSDYRPVDGVLLPHRITRSVDGAPSEEMEMSKYKINPPLKAEKFQK